MAVRTTLLAVGIIVAGTATALFAGPDHRVADAVEARDLNAVRALMGQRVDVNGTQADGATGLHWAAHWDDLQTAKSLLAAGAAVDAINELGVSPLSIACTHSGVQMVDLLLAAGARSDLALPSGETP